LVPDSYDGKTRLPLMLNLHGTGGNAALACRRA
jgi:poly(3-hydroxybutyrate) depolymerase